MVGKKENGKSNKRKKRELNIKTVSYFIAIVGKHWLIFGRLRGKGTTLKTFYLKLSVVCCCSQKLVFCSLNICKRSRNLAFGFCMNLYEKDTFTPVLI